MKKSPLKNVPSNKTKNAQQSLHEEKELPSKDPKDPKTQPAKSSSTKNLTSPSPQKTQSTQSSAKKSGEKKGVASPKSTNSSASKTPPNSTKVQRFDFEDFIFSAASIRFKHPQRRKNQKNLTKQIHLNHQKRIKNLRLKRKIMEH